MRITDVYNSKAIAAVYNNAASNRIPYLGKAFFPAKKKMGLDLKWIKTSKGLPVSLMPSAFDTVSSIRSREGMVMEKTQMAFFKESMLIKEEDEQEILRVKDSSDPYADAVISSIYDDANTLVEGADVVPERMIMQLLSTEGGNPSISIVAGGASYIYNYDPDNSYKENNYIALSGNDAWSATETSDPLADVKAGQAAIKALKGVVPTILVVNDTTMGYLERNKALRGYVLTQNANANVMMTSAVVKQLFKSVLGVDVIEYDKMYKDESGEPAKFFPDGFATLLPTGKLGNTWYGTTPDERSLIGQEGVDTTIVNTGVAVTVARTTDPVNTKTTVSEICLPSFERMNETYTIKAY